MTDARAALSASRPFPGLRPFAYEDHAFFFGRRRQISALFRLLDLSNFVAVIGSSGSGKSSIVRAGLLPLLEHESREEGGPNWLWTEMRPGDAPLANLAQALARLASDDDEALADNRRERIALALSGSSMGLVPALADALRKPPVRPASSPSPTSSGAAPVPGSPPGPATSKQSVVILVDQFEELFRFSGADTVSGRDSAVEPRRREEAAHFVQLLLEVARDRTSGIHIVITMRSDFIGDCARFPGLPEAVSSSQLLVPGLSREQREEVIRKPIALAGATIDSQLVERLLNAVSDDLDQLPVLQHTLLRLWEQAGKALPAGSDQPRRLTLVDYEAIGGMAGALSRHADEVMRSLPGLEKPVELVFRALSEVDRDGRATRRAIPVSQLEAETGVAADELIRVLDRFRADDCSFLVPSPSVVPGLEPPTRVDVGHEALLRRWEKISGEAKGSDSEAAAEGWLAAEDADGRQYRALLSLLGMAAHPQAATLPLDQAEARLKWWRAWARTPAWAERYGGRIDTVQRLLDNSMAALDAERRRAASDEARRQAEEQQRLQLESEARAERLNAASARRANRILQMAMAAIAVLLVVAIGATVYAVQQQARAEALAEQASKNASDAKSLALQSRANLDQTVKVTTLFVQQLRDDMRTGTIAIAAATELVKGAEPESKMLSAGDMQGEDDANTRASFEIIYAEALAASGDREAALKQAEFASQIADKNLASDPEGQAELNNSAAGHEAIGDAELSQQDQTGTALLLTDANTYAATALSQYIAAFDIATKLAGFSSDKLAVQLQLASLATKAGDAASSMQDQVTAQSYYNQAQTIRTALSTDQSGSDATTVQLRRSEGALAMSKNQFGAAIEAYNKALTAANDWAMRDPAAIQPPSEIVEVATSLGDVAIQSARDDADFGAAEANYEQAREAAQALHDRDPSNVRFVSDLRIVETDIGNLYRARAKLADATMPARQFARAYAAYAKALDAAQSLLEADPSSLLWQAEMAQSQIDLGDMLLDQNLNLAAAVDYEAATVIDNKLLAAEPNNADWLQRRCLDQQRIDQAKTLGVSITASGSKTSAANPSSGAAACSSMISIGSGATNMMGTNASCQLPTPDATANSNRPPVAGAPPPVPPSNSGAMGADTTPAGTLNPGAQSAVCGPAGPTRAVNLQPAGGANSPLSMTPSDDLSAHAKTR